ncbi:hypothetical protein BDV93DRAFT_606304 [Ceratobasidium sp. AG-I]|nr:hypothetical protein BDV93DRAFT_606304 [Ceratobasidium sp. AG-I]
MPKSSKKRKEKAADFAKAKLKLGKGKQPASNVIDTSFKARSVALPNQTIRTEEHVAEHGVPTTRRRLTYDDLLVHLRHYSPGMRKDALQGLRELLGDHPELIVPNLGSLLNAVAKLIADDDHSVRKSLITFLEWVLDQIPSSALIPHAPPLLLFAAAALAHILAAVRADAVRVIRVLLEHVPTAVVSGAGLRSVAEEGPGARILDGLLAALGIGDSRGVGGDASLTNSTKSTLLSTLSLFLQHALVSPSSSASPGATTGSIPTWYFANSFPSVTAFESFVGTFASRDSNLGLLEGYAELDKFGIVRGPIGCDLDTLESGDLGLDFDNLENGTGSDTSALTVLASRLHPLLTATFLDNAPQLNLELSSTSASLDLVLNVTNLTRLIYGAAIRDGNPNEETFDNLNALLGHMAPYFPFGDRIGLGIGETIGIKVREAMQTLNLAYCELVSLLVSRTLPTDPISRRRAKKGGKGTGEDLGGSQVSEVAAYIVRCLRGGAGSTTGLASALSSTSYIALLPTLWALRTEQDVMSTVLQHATSGSGVGNKAVKRAATEFVGRIVLLDSDPRCISTVGLDKESVKEWVLGLPRTVWEFGEKDVRGTEVVLLVLLRVNQRRLFDEMTLGVLRHRLAPFFIIDHATRGPVPGPWTKLPEHTQRLALDTASSLCQGGEEGVAELSSAVERATAGKKPADYWQYVRVTPQP